METEEQILKVKFLVYAFRLYLKHKLILLLFFVFNAKVPRSGFEQVQYLVPRKYLKKIVFVSICLRLMILLFFYLGQLECMLGTTRH
jgi:hypothetical protein